MNPIQDSLRIAPKRRFTETNPLTQEVVSRIGARTIYKNAEYAGEYDADGIPCGRGELKYEGCLYTGTLVNGYPEGRGTLMVLSGVIFNGEFVKGVATGMGILKTVDFQCEGRFENGYLHGHGTYSEGNISYMGNFLDGYRHGHGVITTQGYQLEGRFVLNKIYGPARWTCPDGTIVEAHYFASKARTEAKRIEKSIRDLRIKLKHLAGSLQLGSGKCKITSDFLYIDYADRSWDKGRGVLSRGDMVYEGDVKEGLPDGIGEAFYKDCYYCYDGEFVKGLRDGIGRIADVENSYEGLWDRDYIVIEDDRFPIRPIRFDDFGEKTYPPLDVNGNGNGLITDAAGNRYCGAIASRLPHGRGKMMSRDGSISEGDFIEGSLISGRISRGAGNAVGNWEIRGDENIFEGTRSYNGRTIQGKTINNSKEGRVLITFTNGVVFDCHYQNNQATSVRVKYKDIDENVADKAAEFYYTRALDNTKSIVISRSGSVYIGPINENGVAHGCGSVIYPDGSFYKGDFVEGYRHGLGKLTTAYGTYEGRFANSERVRAFAEVKYPKANKLL